MHCYFTFKNVNLAAATIRTFIFSIEMKNAEHNQAITFFTMSSQVGQGFSLFRTRNGEVEYIWGCSNKKLSEFMNLHGR